jgi:hypothetical protein
MTPILTIMIPTTADRDEMFKTLMDEINRQLAVLHLIDGYDAYIEVISLRDNKEISVGLKRQKLLEMANGTWVVGIDSDDFIDPHYIQEIVGALKYNPDTDHVGFLEKCTINGEKSMSIFSIQHQLWDENKYGYDHIRCANPKSVIRRSIALQVGYEDCRFGEDRIFSEAVTPLLKSEVFIDKPLYFYNHISTDHNERYGIK